MGSVAPFRFHLASCAIGGVRLWLREWDPAANRPRNSRGTEVITDRQGRYRFVGAPPGRACLELFADPTERSPSRRAVEPFEVEAGKTHTFDLQLPAR
jgi:hypothetical protein